MKILRNIKRFILSILGLEPVTYSQTDKIQEGINQIYKGASKLLDHNSRFYKEIDERNEGAWRKLAEL